MLVERLLLFLLPPLGNWHPGGADASGTMLPLELLLIGNLDLPGGGIATCLLLQLHCFVKQWKKEIWGDPCLNGSASVGSSSVVL